MVDTVEGKQFDYRELGIRMARRRNQLGIGQKEVGNQVGEGLSYVYISRIERGKARPNFGTVLAILEVLDFDLTELHDDRYWKDVDENEV